MLTCSIVSGLAERSRGAVLTALAEAEAAGLAVRTAGGGFGFVHALVREVLYAGWTSRSRAALAPAGGGGAGGAATATPGRPRSPTISSRPPVGEPDERCVELRRPGRRTELGGPRLRGGGALVRAGPGSTETRRPPERATCCSVAGKPGSRLATCPEHARRTSGRRRWPGRTATPNGWLGRPSGWAPGWAASRSSCSIRCRSIYWRKPSQRSGRNRPRCGPGCWPGSPIALSLMADESRRRSLSDEAVAVARASRRPAGARLRAGRPTATPRSGPDGCDDRVAASAEIVRLGAETGDRPLELLGLRLRIVALLEIGDVERPMSRWSVSR